MNIYKPTWLYIKQHNQTGLKYFGKTMNDPFLYKGSGTHWMRHIRKHGNDVTTIWCQLFNDKESLTSYALCFSESNKIVESNEWANLRPENGIDGIPKGSTAKNKGIPRTQQVKDAVSKANKGRLIGDKNPSRRPELREFKRKMTTENNPSRGKSWIVLGDQEQLVPRDTLDLWITNGWTKGRIVTQSMRDRMSSMRCGQAPWNKK